MQVDEAHLRKLERSLRHRLASGEFDQWLMSTDSAFSTPPWYELGLEIVRLRSRLRGSELADHARQLIRDELRRIESRLCDERQRESFGGDSIGYQFSKIRPIIGAGSDDAECNFVAFVLSATAEDVEQAKPPAPEIQAQLPFTLTKWEDLQVQFQDDFNVEFSVGHESRTYGYAELGLADRRKGNQATDKPVKAWETLRELAEGDGKLGWGRAANRHMVEKRVQEIRGHLKKHFGLTSDPIPLVGGHYVAKFRVSKPGD